MLRVVNILLGRQRVNLHKENKQKKAPAHNGRFYEMAAVAPQKQQCDFGGFAPARSSVEAATS